MNRELFFLWLSRMIVTIFGKKISHRFLRLFYNNLSPKVKGRLISVPYLLGTDILVNTKDIIGWKIYFFNEYESSTNNLLRKIIENNTVIIEAGANIGSETLLISKLNPDGKIFAFEPAPIPFSLLQFNVANNQLGNVKVYQEAVGETAGKLKLHLLPKEFPNQGLSSIKEHSKSVQSIQVPMTTVDLLVEKFDLERLDLIKMDVQGAEFLILNGGLKSLKKFGPKILLEASSEFLNLEVVLRFLENNDYLVYAFDNEKLSKVDVNHLIEGNWICFHRDDVFHDKIIREW
ncbi:FkbM family methyltransferase [Fulvivirga sp.]|uniref:FkbM family methyltransferase n=1 Tax=Fulvivirga sp. TaxID=1931237 RepID=UPI0032EFEC94